LCVLYQFCFFEFKGPVERQVEVESEEAMHSDSTESVVEDPLEVCEKNLLSHILRVQAEINDKLDKVEEEITSKSLHGLLVAVL